MLKRKFRKQILITTAILFSYFLMNLFPRDDVNIKQSLEYVSSYPKSSIYLLDQYNMVARTSVVISDNNDITKKARNLLEMLILEGESEVKLPSGFKGIIPSDTKILDITYDNDVLKVDFSSNILDIDEYYEEKMIEAIVFTLTEIDGVDKVIIYVEGEILSKLPKSKVNLPGTLDRSFGINKEFLSSTYSDVNKVTIYYVSKYNDDYYYVPVTKYMDKSDDKIKIIIDELSSSSFNSTNLMSFLNDDVKLLATLEDVDSLFLVFNEFIFNDMDTKSILEEVVYSISLSVRDNYDVKEVIFKYDDNEIYKSVLKSLE